MVILSGVFVGLGLSGALPPAVLPVLGDRFAQSPERMSLLVPAMFAGLMVGVLATAVGATARAPERAIVLGAVVQAAGLLVLAAASVTGGALVGAFVLGAGFGATELSAVAVARSAGSRQGRLLARLTAVLAVTSALAPLALGALVDNGSWRAVLFAAAGVHLLTALLLARSGQRTVTGPVSSWAAAMRPHPAHLSMVGYVGAEAVVAAWMARIASGALEVSVAGAAGATAAFWVVLAMGRLGGSRLLLSVAAPRLLRVSLVGAAGALAVLAAASGVPRLVAVVAGLVCAGPVYALLLATAPTASDARALGVLVGAGALGGAVIGGAGAVAFSLVGLSGVLALAAGSLGLVLVAVLLGERAQPAHVAVAR